MSSKHNPLWDTMLEFLRDFPRARVFIHTTQPGGGGTWYAPTMLSSTSQFSLQTLQKLPSLDAILNEPNRSKFDLLVLANLPISSGQSLHFENLSHLMLAEQERD